MLAIGFLITLPTCLIFMGLRPAVRRLIMTENIDYDAEARNKTLEPVAHDNRTCGQGRFVV